MGNPTDERQSARTISLKITFFWHLLWKKSRVSFCQDKGFYSNKNNFIIFTPTFTLFQLLFYKPVPATSTLWLREDAGSVGFWNYSTAKGEVKCLSWIWCTWIRFLISGHCSVTAKELTDACTYKTEKKGVEQRDSWTLYVPEGSWQVSDCVERVVRWRVVSIQYGLNQEWWQEKVPECTVCQFLPPLHQSVLVKLKNKARNRHVPKGGIQAVLR